MDLINVTITLIAILNFVLLLIVHLRSPRNRSIRFFKLSLFAAFMWCVSMIFYRSADSTANSIIWAKSLYAFASLIPGGFLLHSLSFPNSLIPKKVLIPLVSVISLIFVACYWGSLVIHTVEIADHGEKLIIFGPFYYVIYVAYLLLMFSLVFISYLHRRKKVSNVERFQINFIVVGLLISTSFAVISNLILPTLGVFNFNWLGQVMTTAWLAVFSYTIIRHQFIDVRTVVLRSLSYLSLLFLILILIGSLITVFTSTLLDLELTTTQLFTLTLLFSMFVVLLIPLKKYFDSLTEQIFFRYAYSQSELLHELNQNIANHLELHNLGQEVLKTLHQALKFSTGDIYISNSKTLISFQHDSNDVKSNSSTELTDIVKLLEVASKDKEKVISLDTLSEGNLKAMLRKNKINLIAPFILKNNLVGGLILGEKSSGDYYTEQDVSLVQIICPELAVAFTNSNAYEEILHFNITLREEVENATASLKKANARLRELDRMKDEFVSLASHELRTPLTSIKYNLWMMLQEKAGRVTEKQKMYLERAYSSTNRLTKMVNDMLNISRIESNRIILNPFRSHIHAVVDEVVEELRPRAKQLGIRLVVASYAIKPDSTDKIKLPDVIIDRDKIKEVLVNLIGNSLKFTPKDGQIRVWFEVDHDFVWVHVTDSGIGFDPAKTHELFKKFGMIRESYAAYKDASQGTGLGLYICKSIINLHGGQIKARSTGQNQGATFSFSVPVYSEKLKRNFAQEFAGKTDAGIIMTQVMAE